MTNRTNFTHQCWIHCQYIVLILAVLQNHTRSHPLTSNYISQTFTGAFMAAVDFISHCSEITRLNWQLTSLLLQCIIMKSTLISQYNGYRMMKPLAYTCVCHQACGYLGKKKVNWQSRLNDWIKTHALFCVVVVVVCDSEENGNNPVVFTKGGINNNAT